jgi:hypothetical protein
MAQCGASADTRNRHADKRADPPLYSTPRPPRPNEAPQVRADPVEQVLRQDTGYMSHQAEIVAMPRISVNHLVTA